MREFMNLLESYLSGGRAPLHHFTDAESARYILEQGKLNTELFGSGEVATTRNKNLGFNNHLVRIDIDADIVRHNTKVRPFDYWNQRRRIYGEGKPRDEAEERIYGDVSTKAITAITIFKRDRSPRVEANVAIIKQHAERLGIPVIDENE